MFKLKAFGSPYLAHLTDTRQRKFETALPLLIAAYIIVEHQGEAKREQVHELFFPMTPIYPQQGSHSGRMIYERLWECGKNEQNSSIISIAKIELATFSTSELELESACQELKNYSVIEHYQLEHEDLKCWLTSPFKKYLSGFRNDDKSRIIYDEEEKKRKIHNICLTHIGTLRKFVEKFVSDECQLAEIIPKGNRGKKGNPFFIIHIECDTTELEKALADSDFEQIKTVYRGVFLAGIENKIREGFWLSPILRDWIHNKRQEFAQRVSQTLLNIVQDLKQQTEEQRIDLVQSIQAFCQNHGLYDKDLKQAIDAHLHPNDGSGNLESAINVSAPMVQNPFVQTAFTLNRHHLLAKMKEICDFQLKMVPRPINTQIAIETLNYPTTTSFPVAERQHFSEMLFGLSYGFMVLVGEAGMGKSWFLYHVTQQLIEEAKRDKNKPIPLLFHLADWRLYSLPFEKWLKLELIQLGLAEKEIDSDFNALLSDKQCVFLLDGFDNLPPIQWSSRLKIINDFIQKHGESRLGGLIMASRPDEYQIAKRGLLEEQRPITFHFHAEATLQALSVEEGCSYITEQLSPLPLETLMKSEAFRQFLITPLGLILLIESAESEQIAEKTEPDFDTAKNTLISNYIHNSFKRIEESYQKKNQPLPYTASEVTRWLGHIARSMPMGSAFSVEGLLPGQMLTDKQRHHYQWSFVVFFGLVFGAMMGGVAGLIFGDSISKLGHVPKDKTFLPDAFIGIHQVLVQWIDSSAFADKIALVISYASIGMVSAVLMSSLTFLLFKHIRFSIFLGGYLGLSLGTTGWLTVGSLWSIFIIIFYGTLGFLMGWLIDSKYTNSLIIDLHKDTRLSYKGLSEQKQDMIRSGLLIFASVSLMSIFSLFLPKLSLGIALLQGVAIGVSFILAYIFYRLKTQTDWQGKDFLPRQKIKVALKRSVLMMLIIGGSITSLVTGLSTLSTEPLEWPGNLSFGLRVGMPLGIVTGFMLYGGSEVLKHLTLRWVMYRYKIAPWHYTRFLEYAKLLTFLKPQSGGYAFRHDWFQEYFNRLVCQAIITKMSA